MTSEIDRTVDAFLALAFSGDAQFSLIPKKDLPAAASAAIETALQTLEP
jgi:hypothetical protein